MSKTLREIAAYIQGELTGGGEVTVKGISGIKEANEGDLTLLLDIRQEHLIDTTGASCVIVPRTVTGSHTKPLIKVEYPSVAFSKLIDLFMPGRIPHPKGIHKTAVIAPGARLGKDVAVGPYAVIEDGVTIGDRSVVYPFVYVGKATTVGADCIIYANVTIREAAVIGSRVTIHPGSVIGADGFGYDIMRDGTPVKIPQLGIVVIEDDVEIGACVTIDRARFMKTVIGKGSKIDNLVQIAHNVTIGPCCLIAAQTGIAGSSKLGRNVILGGQVGIADHLTIGDFVKAGAKTGISKSYPEAGTTLFWYPAKPVEKARDIIAAISLLPKLYGRVRDLEAKVKELQGHHETANDQGRGGGRGGRAPDRQKGEALPEERPGR